MPVDIHRRADAPMPQASLHDVDWHSRRKQPTGMRMPKVMEAHSDDARYCGDPLIGGGQRVGMQCYPVVPLAKLAVTERWGLRPPST